MAIHKQMNAQEWAILITLSILWGGSFFFVGVAVKELPPLTIVMVRVALAALILLATCRFLNIKIPREPFIWKSFFIMGLLNNIIPFCLIVWGQTQIASGTASILNAATPFFTVIVAHFLTADETMTRNKVIGVIIGFIGVAIMIGPAALIGNGSSVWGQLAIICATISYSFVSIYGRRFKTMGIQPLTIATCQLTAASLILIPVTLIVDQPWTLDMPSIQTFASLIGIATLSTALAYMLYFRILATAGATNLSLVTFLIPVSAVMLGIALLGEQLALKQVLGMSFIALGLIAIDGRILLKFSRLFK